MPRAAVPDSGSGGPLFIRGAPRRGAPRTSGPRLEARVPRVFSGSRAALSSTEGVQIGWRGVCRAVGCERRFGGAPEVSTPSPLLLCRERPDRGLQFVERESNSFGPKTQGVLTQIAAFVENGQQHQTGTQIHIELRFFITISEQHRPL